MNRSKDKKKLSKAQKRFKELTELNKELDTQIKMNEGELVKLRRKKDNSALKAQLESLNKELEKLVSEKQANRMFGKNKQAGKSNVVGQGSEGAHLNNKVVSQVNR